MDYDGFPMNKEKYDDKPIEDNNSRRSGQY